jgi:ATP-dependent Zn protease
MANNSEKDLVRTLEEVLKLYGIELDKDVGAGGKGGEKGAVDYSEIIGKTQAKIDDLTERAEEIYKRTGMTREQLEAFASNPNNFTPEQWDTLQKVREACEKYKEEAKKLIVDEQFEQKVAAQQKQKQLQRFAKKKHWIPL